MSFISGVERSGPRTGMASEGTGADWARTEAFASKGALSGALDMIKSGRRQVAESRNSLN